MKTPKTLRDAIENGIEDMTAREVKVFAPDIIRDHVQDYLAQRFTIAYSQVTDYNELVRLQKLWASVIK